MSVESAFEIVIVGGAVVGTAAARALGGASSGGLRIAMVSQGPRPAAADPAGAVPDARVYAISPANAAFLAQLGAWSAIPEARRTPVRAMRVYGDDGESLIEFDAYRSGCGELAWIVEDCWLQDALWRGLESQDGVTLFHAASVEALEISAARAGVLLGDGRELRAKLVVGADGAHSFVRERAGIKSKAQAYAQTAVVANFSCARPHRNVAYQWFQGGAVLALLPLSGDRVSMVWSAGDAAAARLLGLDGNALAAEVAAATRDVVGELALVTPQRGFPLQRLLARRLVTARIALVGDAAHVIHPLAGQGANLGLQDARQLAAAIAGREPGRDPGDERLLRRYERSRAEDILAMRATVHGLYRLFDARGAAVSRLRNAGLNLADRMPVLKNLLMRHAMG